MRILVCLLILTSGCVNKASKMIGHPIDEKYELPHFSGKAEICTYELDKSRYGQNREGEAVLIFVTEPFDKNSQVKPDDYDKNSVVDVLKMNRIDRFTTGIYDYSQFTSNFTPLSEHSPKFPLKTTMSSQDWCGQSFYQLNNDTGFKLFYRSYFEGQGDDYASLDYAVVEDNLFNLARIDTSLLPTGNFKIIPALSYITSNHIELKSYDCEAILKEENGKICYEYNIIDLERQVKVVIDASNNNQIQQWIETFPSGNEDKMLSSTYRLKSTVNEPYWEMNSNSFSSFRDSLKLGY